MTLHPQTITVDAGHRRPPVESGSPVAPIGTREWIAALLIGLLFLVPLLSYGPWDNEEAGLGIFASQLHYRALLDGRWLWWLHDLGFGTPLPLGSRLDFHPLFFLAGVTSLRTLLSVLWLVHVTVMVVYFMRLAAVSSIRPPLRLILLTCYVFSAASVCLFYQTDWISCIIAWTTFPALIFYVRESVHGGAATQFWLNATRLGLLFGFVVLNSHPGYLAPLFTVLGIYFVAVSRLDLRAVMCLVAAGVMSAGMAAERLYFLATEMQRFPPALARAIQPGYPLAAYWAAAVAPVIPARDDLRLPFIGVVFGLAALTSVLLLKRLRDRDQRACAIAFAGAVLLSLAPRQLSFGASGLWLFRDPMVVFGLLAAAPIVQRGLDASGAAPRRAAWALVALQIAQQGATVWPGFYEFWRHSDDLLFYRYQEQRVGLVKVLADSADAFGPRLYMSDLSQRLARGGLSRYGLHFSTDLVFHGIAPVNGWFKNVAMDSLYPSYSLMHGYIGGQRDVIENGTLLDVLGVNLVLTTAKEGPVPEGLSIVNRMPVERFMDEQELLVLANPDAWPEAVLLSADAPEAVLPLRPGCEHTGALCRDFRAVFDKRLPGDVQVDVDDGRYRLRVASADQPRVLFLSTAYRPEWIATSPSGSLQIRPIANAFMGVVVPPGIDTIEMEFVPRTRMLLTWFSGSIALVVVASFVVLSRPAWRR